MLNPLLVGFVPEAVIHLVVSYVSLFHTCHYQIQGRMQVQATGLGADVCSRDKCAH
jgi:hypothetical protein